MEIIESANVEESDIIRLLVGELEKEVEIAKRGKTLKELMEEMKETGKPMNEKKMRSMLAHVKKQGRLKVERVERETLDGRIIRVPAYYVED